MANTLCCFCVIVAGVFLISLALCADAVIGNVQEKTIKHFSASNAEVVCICLQLCNYSQYYYYYCLLPSN